MTLHRLAALVRRLPARHPLRRHSTVSANFFVERRPPASVMAYVSSVWTGRSPFVAARIDRVEPRHHPEAISFQDVARLAPRPHAEVGVDAAAARRLMSQITAY